MLFVLFHCLIDFMLDILWRWEYLERWQSADWSQGRKWPLWTRKWSRGCKGQRRMMRPVHIVVLRNLSRRLRWTSWRFSWQCWRDVATVAAAVVVHVEETADSRVRHGVGRCEIARVSDIGFEVERVSRYVGWNINVCKLFQLLLLLLLLIRRSAKIWQRGVNEIELWR